MATTLDTLKVKIEADLSGLKKGMAQANESVKKSSSGMSKSLGNLSKSLQKLSTRAVKVGAVLGYSDKEIQDFGSRLLPTLCHPEDLEHVLAHFTVVAN